MPKFAASGVSGALTTTVKTAVGIRQPASPTNVVAAYCVVLGSPATAADGVPEWVIQRVSTAGTNTTVTATDVEDAGQTATTLAGQTYTVEPTPVSNTILLDVGLNQRATYTIVMAEGYEWKIAVTATRGIAVSAKIPSTTPTVLASIYWKE